MALVGSADTVIGRVKKNLLSSLTACSRGVFETMYGVLDTSALLRSLTHQLIAPITVCKCGWFITLTKLSEENAPTNTDRCSKLSRGHL